MVITFEIASLSQLVVHSLLKNYLRIGRLWISLILHSQGVQVYLWYNSFSIEEGKHWFNFHLNNLFILGNIHPTE